MKLFKRAGLAAALSVAALAVFSGSALADPIGVPYSANGTVSLNGGLGGSTCTNTTIDGFTDGNSVDDITFAGCSGAAGTPSAHQSGWDNLPWAVSWTGTTGTVTGAQVYARVLGFLNCYYSVNLSIAYAAGPPETLTITGSGTRVSPSSGLCPASVSVTGSLTI